nr:hypothetical protein [uncultured Rhodoferax sp.]
MNTELQNQPLDPQTPQDLEERKTWVTPVVSESPVNEVTTFGINPSSDGAAYS